MQLTGQCLTLPPLAAASRALPVVRCLHPSLRDRGGQSLVDRLLKHYERLGDVQTLATIVCVLNAAHPDTLLQVRTTIH